MGTDGLLPLAKKLANAPLIDIYFEMVKRVNKSASNTPEDYKNKAYIAQAGTICDLNAYLLMVVAAGVTRIEALKKALRTKEALLGKAEAHTALKGGGQNDGEDRGKVFQTGQGKDFSSWMETWASFNGHGVVQLKFNPGPHTFMIERVPLSDGQDTPAVNGYRVYQAYEGVYRLADFLGLASDDGDEPIFRQLANDYPKGNAPELEVWKRFVAEEAASAREDTPESEGIIANTKYLRFRMTQLFESHSNIYGNFIRHDKQYTKLKAKEYPSEDAFQTALWKKQRLKVKEATAELVNTTKTIGRGQNLSLGALRLNVLTPLCGLLAGTLPAADLQKLTGVPPDNKWPQATGRLVVMMCDQVDFNQYATNYQALVDKKLTADMTEYAKINDSNDD